MVVETIIIHVGVVRMSQGVAEAGLSAAADEIDLGRSERCSGSCCLLQPLLITFFAGAVCAGDRVWHDHQHCAQGARHAERVRP